MTPTQYYGSSERYPAPPGYSHQWFNKLCRNEKTRPPGAFKGPGRSGWMITVEDYDAWMRGKTPAVSDDTQASIEADVRRRFHTTRK